MTCSITPQLSRCKKEKIHVPMQIQTTGGGGGGGAAVAFNTANLRIKRNKF